MTDYAAGESILLSGILTEISRREFKRGWSFGKLIHPPKKRDPRNPHATVISKISGPIAQFQNGDHVDVVGSFEDHEKHGMSLRALDVSRSMPKRSEELKKWFIDTFPNIGDARVEAMFKELGPDVAASLDADDAIDRLATISGITLDRAFTIVTAWLDARKKYETYVEFLRFGLTGGEIKQALNVGLTVDSIRDDPLVLYYVSEISLGRVEEVMRHVCPQVLGSEAHRLAQVHFSAKKQLEQGDTALTMHALIRGMKEDFPLFAGVTEQRIKDLIAKGGGRMVYEHDLVSPGKLARAEAIIADYVRRNT